MPSIGIKASINITGPLLTADGGRLLRGAIEDGVEDILEEGERDVVSQLYPGHGLVTGHYRRSINSELDDSLNGTIHDSRVVYGPWLEGVSSRNSATSFKGYAMFRNAVQRLERSAGGIMRRHIEAAVRRLGGR